MTRNRLLLGIIIAALLVGAGYGFATLRFQSRIAGADAREQKRMEAIAIRDAESNKLRGENDELRKDIAEKSASEEALRQIIAQHGGVIENEAKKVEQISNDLKTDQTVINAPSDRCTRCRRFSATALATGLIKQPLTCADECGSANK
jgi:hypothetical protein